MTTALRHPYLLAVLAFLVLLALAFLVVPTLVEHTPGVYHLLGSHLKPALQYGHGSLLTPDVRYRHG